MEGSSSSLSAAATIHPPMHLATTTRSLDGSFNNEITNDPYLICQWHWEDSNAAISQNCEWRFPNSTITTASGAYEVSSTCSWETLYATTFQCEVSGFDGTGARSITYKAECNAEQLAKSNRNACKALSASIPTRDPACQECEWNIRKQRRVLRWLEGDGEYESSMDDNEQASNGADFGCDQECWTATESCKRAAFPKREKKAVPDYNGIPWAESLVETMQWAVLMGMAKEPIAFYDVPLGQPSLESHDFAQGMTFYCPSGRYQGSELLLIDSSEELRSGGWGILKGAIILLVASAVLLIYLKRYGHCSKRPTRRIESDDSLQRAGSRLMMAGSSDSSSGSQRLHQQQPPSPTCSDEEPLPPLPTGFHNAPRSRASSSPVLHTVSLAGENLVVQDGIWRPKRRKNTASSWHEGDDESMDGSISSSRSSRRVVVAMDHHDDHHHHDIDPYGFRAAPDMDHSSVASTDYDDILQEVI